MNLTAIAVFFVLLVSALIGIVLGYLSAFSAMARFFARELDEFIKAMSVIAENEDDGK